MVVRTATSSRIKIEHACDPTLLHSVLAHKQPAEHRPLIGHRVRPSTSAQANKSSQEQARQQLLGKLAAASRLRAHCPCSCRAQRGSHPCKAVRRCRHTHAAGTICAPARALAQRAAVDLRARAPASPAQPPSPSLRVGPELDRRRSRRGARPARPHRPVARAGTGATGAGAPCVRC